MEDACGSSMLEMMHTSSMCWSISQAPLHQCCGEAAQSHVPVQWQLSLSKNYEELLVELLVVLEAL